ncbi:hypothetical protein [Streptosporangium sp. NPDC051022]|uniref:hypothetical protein n=1 Tax=Streptosporangium sp. NPDC051022 TaxID=3155752 RepID=UPI0034279A29
MRYQQDLQVALRDRLRRVMTEHFMTAGHQVRLIVDWIATQPPLVAILAEAQRAEPDLDLDEFIKSFERVFTWSSRTEEGQAALIWKLMQQVADEDRKGEGSRQTIISYASTLSSRRDLNDNWREFAERVLAPLFEFLSERVGVASSVLYVLERYVRQVEWFDREKLHARFKEHSRTGEEIYNLDLQRFLFLDGNYITHAKPRSASGEADLIGGLETHDPLICDGKIFDGSGRGKSYLAKGFNQIVQYAQDH